MPATTPRGQKRIGDDVRRSLSPHAPHREPQEISIRVDIQLAEEVSFSLIDP